MNLQCIAEFNQRPSGDFVGRWRTHISSYGTPEKFEGVSTSKPPRTASVVLLSEDIKVPVSLRLGGDRVPCPLCSPTAPKFETGRMAWFPDDAAVRFIGHSCAKKYLGENYIAAERLFKLEAACAEYLDIWPKLQAIRTKMDAIADRMRIAAHGMRSTRAKIDAEAPRFTSFLYRDLVHSNGTVITSKAIGAKSHTVVGLDFISEDFYPEGTVGRIAAACEDLKSSLPHWRQADGDNHSAAEIIKRGRRVEKAAAELASLREYLEQSRKFLLPSNLHILRLWAKSGLSPMTRFFVTKAEDDLHLDVAWYDGAFNVTFKVHSGFDAPLPTAEEVDQLGLDDILNRS